MARELVQVISPASGDLESADHSSHSGEPFPNFYIFVGAVAVVIVLMIVIILCWKLFKTEDVMKDLKQSKAKQASQELWSGNLRTVNYFDFQTLKKATRNFNSAYFLGRGGFGPVYRGKLPDGRLVAIKKLSLGKSLQGESEFVSEVRMITSIQHKNLVQLLGCCVDGPQRLLVYEYMKNRSLDLIVNGKSNQCLDWNTRFQIILGIARGLQYLHEDSQLRIVHRDIKASNILLDDKFQPRIGDFGLARFFPEDQAYLSTTFAGTLGYTAPEYAIRGELSEKADIYSFGVLVLEIISSRKNTDLNLPTEMQYLPEYAWRLHDRSRVKEIVDPRLQHGNGTIDRDIMLVIHVAFLCLQPHANLRPPMSQIVAMLTCKVSPVGSPLRPTFLERRRRLDENLSWDTISEAFPSMITTMSNESPPTPS